jgi:hypothetical protein
LGYLDSPNLYQFLNRNPVNFLDPLGLYEKDIHFYAVYYLARKAGFAREQAEQIAWASQQVDDHPATCPDPSCAGQWGLFQLGPGAVLYVDVLKAFHFLQERNAEIVTRNNQEVRSLVAAAESSRDLFRLGIAMHTLADSYSHEFFKGSLTLFPPNIGHAGAGHMPDQPYANPVKALSALAAMYRELASLSGRALFSEEEVIRELESASSWPLFEFKDGSRARISALALRDDEPGRSRLWHDLILEKLGEDVVYDPQGKPGWRESFERAAAEQVRFVADSWRR